METDARALVRERRRLRNMNTRLAFDFQAENQALRLEFLCECGQPDCDATITLATSDWEALGALRDFYAVAPGHAVEGLDQVIVTRNNNEIVASTRAAG